jgi:uncharacterized membrane protein
MRSNITRKIVVAGVMSAIAILLGATRWGFIPWFAGASITIMMVPVVIGAVLEGPVVGLIIGFLFGLFSLIQAAVAPTGPVDVWFTNPLLSIVPRLFIGPVAWAIYRLVQRAGREGSLILSGLIVGLTAAFSYLVGQNDVPTALIIAGLGLGLAAALLYRAFARTTEELALTMAGVAGSVTNTVLVLGVIGLLGYLPWAALPAIAIANGIPEAIVAAILTLVVVSAWHGAERGGRRGADL